MLRFKKSLIKPLMGELELFRIAETKQNSILLSLRVSRINLDILAQDQHIKPSLLQLIDRILLKLQ